MEILFLIIWLLLGVWCSKVAEQKGRNNIAWFVIGVIFGIFGVVAVYIASDLKAPCNSSSCNCQH